MNLFFVGFDIALGALSARSMLVLGSRAPYTSAGWGGTIGYCAAAIAEGYPPWHRVAALIAYAFVIFLAIAFAVAGIRREPQAAPWWWPVRAQPHSSTSSE